MFYLYLNDSIHLLALFRRIRLDSNKKSTLFNELNVMTVSLYDSLFKYKNPFTFQQIDTFLFPATGFRSRGLKNKIHLQVNMTFYYF